LNERPNNQVGAAFVRDLRQALHNSYDPSELGKSPLVRLFGLQRHPDPALSLRRVLVEAIESLKPGSDVPPHASAWRYYQVLDRRFVEQIPQRDISISMALSVRQLRRQEVAALRVLADQLWGRYGLQLQAGRVPVAGEAPPAEAEEVGADREIEWLRTTLPLELTDVAEFVQSVIQTIGPLCQAAQVLVELALPVRLPRLAVQPTTLRQALISILTVAARCVRGGRVCLEAQVHGDRACLEVRVEASRRHAAPAPLTQEDREGLELARQLVALSGGVLELELEPQRGRLFSARLVLPAAQELTVLIIDDNADTLHLFQRYLAGSRYSVLAIQHPGRALELAQEMQPAFIVLDVMLPGVDGWELLGRLREHPATRGIPIIVCTILPQERLAMTLGAAAFLRKPVSRTTLLAALDAQAG